MLGWQPLPDALLRALEAQHPPPDWTATTTAADWQRYAGMWCSACAGVGLGGRGQWPGGAQRWAERMTVPVALLRQHPHLRLLFTGGEGVLLTSGEPEAVQARAFFESLGVPAQRMQFGYRLRTTYENAIFTAVCGGGHNAALAARHLRLAHAARAGHLSRGGLERDTVSGGLPHRHPHAVDRSIHWSAACRAGRLRCMDGWACSPTG